MEHASELLPGQTGEIDLSDDRFGVMRRAWGEGMVLGTYKGFLHLSTGKHYDGKGFVWSSDKTKGFGPQVKEHKMLTRFMHELYAGA